MDKQENFDEYEEDWIIDWERRRGMAVVQVLCFVVYAIYLCHVYFYQTHDADPATSTDGNKRKSPDEDTCRRQFRRLRKAIHNVAEAIREGNLILSRSRACIYSEEEIFNQLVSMGLDQKMRYEAYTFLIKSGTRVRAFFGCPVQERKDLLLQMLDGSLDC